MKSYKDLEVYNIAFELAIKVHNITLELPKYEVYEQGSQLRRSSKSIKDNIAEGYGRRKYKADFIKFLIYGHASLLECKSQLEMIEELYDIKEISVLIKEYDVLGAKLYTFISYVENNWKS
ncbi:four helix bundle protein [Wenyingzhuangia aestuarii]|uniref:four helix bundle protein n=1 Tax=Wenyingzhuangia aestuarii TaxID=1647582 RepID=UPI00143B0263|nr:four helix bundle protein [Wenyingzhuangia aestuarii]NJB81733.1 four helix bundle protein [Wenyingzhuangia aestuarii]